MDRRNTNLIISFPNGDAIISKWNLFLHNSFLISLFLSLIIFPTPNYHLINRHRTSGVKKLLADRRIGSKVYAAKVLQQCSEHAFFGAWNFQEARWRSEPIYQNPWESPLIM